MINYIFLDTHHYINRSARFGVNSTTMLASTMLRNSRGNHHSKHLVHLNQIKNTIVLVYLT